MIIVNYRVNQRAPRLIIPSLPIYAIPSSCLPIHPRDIPPPPILIRFTPPSTVQLFISYDRSGWYGDPEPERNNVSTFLWNVIRDDGWKVSIIISIELWKRERRRKKERKKREMSRRSISHTHHTTHRSRLIFLRLPSPPIFQKNGNRNRSTEATFSLARKLDKTFSKGRKIEISNSQV